jgi:hypothetical protein
MVDLADHLEVVSKRPPFRLQSVQLLCSSLLTESAHELGKLVRVHNSDRMVEKLMWGGVRERVTKRLRTKQHVSNLITVSYDGF